MQSFNQSDPLRESAWTLKHIVFCVCEIPNGCVLNSIFMVVLSAILNLWTLIFSENWIECTSRVSGVLKHRHRFHYANDLYFDAYTPQYTIHDSTSKKPKIKNQQRPQKKRTVNNQPIIHVSHVTLSANTLSHAWNSFVWHQLE